MKRTGLRITLTGAAVIAMTCTLNAQDPNWVSMVTNQVKLENERAFCIYVSDINNDRYPDMITVEGVATENLLRVYMNVKDTAASNPDGRIFVDVTGTSGVNDRADGQPSRGTIAVALADINNDGFVDMVRGNYYHRLVGYTDVGDRCEVLLGDGQGRFTLVEGNGLHELGLVNTIGFSFLDYDKDGNIDLFIPSWFKDYDRNVWSPGYLMKGNGDGTFTDVTNAAGIKTPEPMYGSTVVDWNNDGWPDIATAPYCRTNGQLLKNNGDGTFTNVASAANYNARYMRGDQGQTLCMWNAVPEDFDNDGDMDFFFSLVHGGNDANEGRSAVFLNGGAANDYKLTPDRSLVVKKAPMSSHNGDYDASWFDIDNDGLMDLAMVQGTYTPTMDRLFIFHHGADHKLTDITGDIGMLGSGMLDLHLIEALDYDLDGDDDLVFCRTGHPRTLQLMDNKIGQDNNWLGVRLVAPSDVNRSSVGARIHVWSGGVKRMREVYAGRGNASGQQPFAMLFGLGNQTRVDSVTVEWPNKSGSSTTVRNPPINSYIDITGFRTDIPKWKPAGEKAIKVYPNPASDFVLVQMTDDIADAALELYNMLGQKVDNMLTGDSRETTRYCSLKTLPVGTYIVKATTKEGTVLTRSFVKH